VCDRERLSTFVPSHLPFRRWEFIIHEHEDKNTFLDEKKIQELISKWLKPEEYRIIRKSVYQFHSVIAKNFQKDNCFLVGDAAHQAPPFMGEGMMSGYRDAVNLAWKIAVTIKNELNNKLLKSYEEERIAHSKFVVENSAGIGELMEAYAQASDPEEVPRELVAKGYGSFVLPNLSNGLFFGGKANETMHSGEIFPQPLQYHNSKIVKRMDHILGSKFCLVSESKFSVSEENKRFLELLGCKSLILKKEYIDENSWLNFFMEQGKTYLIRPDRYIFGSTTSYVTLNELIDDLKIRINLENTI
jgi:3-(3-hydroxy-phenyl)propionate hydroxylase